MLPLRPALRFSLLAAALVAANLVHAEVPASAPFTAEQQQLIRQLSASEVRAAAPKIASEAASSVAKTIEGEKQAIEVAKDTLEVGRKSVDWWLSNIGVLMAILGAVLAAASIGIPYVMGLKRKAEWEEKLEQLTLKLQEAEAAQQKAETAQQQAESHATEIETLLQHAREKTSRIPKADEITVQISEEVIEKLRAEKPSQVVKLIEHALDAHSSDNWEKARPLWQLLSQIESNDSNVWFNYGRSLQGCGADFNEAAINAYGNSLLLEDDVITYSNIIVCYKSKVDSISPLGEGVRIIIEQARDALHKGSAISSEYPDIFYNFAVFQHRLSLFFLKNKNNAESLEKAIEAKKYFEIAIDKEPSDILYLFKFGMLNFYLYKELEGSFSYLLDALRMYEKTATLYELKETGFSLLDVFEFWSNAIESLYNSGKLESNELDDYLGKYISLAEKNEQYAKPFIGRVMSLKRFSE